MISGSRISSFMGGKDSGTVKDHYRFMGFLLINFLLNKTW